MNPYALPPLVTSILALFLGILTFRSINPKVRYTFPLVSAAVFIWLFGYFLAYSTTEYEAALRWIRLLYIGVIFVPAASYHFTVSFLNLKGKTKYIIACYFIGLGFVILSRNEYFIAGAYKYFWGYQTRVGPLHNIFLVFFSLVMARVIILLFLQYKQKRKTSPLEGNRIKYVLISFSVSTLAASDFLPKYGIEWYPLGFLCIAFHAIFSTYAIIRYRILDVNVAIARAGIFAVVYSVVLGIPFYIGYYTKAWFISTLLAVLFATAGPFIYSYLRRKTEARIRKEEFETHKALSRLTQDMMRFTRLKGLLRLIANRLVKVMKLEAASLYLKDKQAYKLMTGYSINKTLPEQTEFNEDSPLIKDILLRREPVVLEELKLIQTSRALPYVRDLQREILKTKAAAIVPAFRADSLFGFLMLGPKRDRRPFSQEDLNILTLLSHQAILAIDNASLIEKDKSLLSEKSRRDALADMAPGVSHQFSNRLAVITYLAGAQRELNQLENIDTLTLEKAIPLLRQSQTAFDNIEKEAMKGKDISEAILKKGRAKLIFQEADLIPVIESAIKLFELSRATADKSAMPEYDIILEAEETLPKLVMNESLMQDIIYNLLKNSVDAIFTRSEHIILSNQPITYKGRIIIRASKKDSGIVIEVEDNGIGMDEKHLKRLFVPYFTTKATSIKGTGMGLWVIRGFIEDHKGTVHVKSEYNMGTTFIITLPLHAKIEAYPINNNG